MNLKKQSRKIISGLKDMLRNILDLFQEYIQRNGLVVSPRAEPRLPDSPIRSFGSNSSLYGTDVVIEEQRQTIEDVAKHVLYCKFMCKWNYYLYHNTLTFN